MLFRSLKWAEGSDPLVIDLDGDGIETVSQSVSKAYFDVDGDLFREKTGWLKGDDGFLVLDGNANGRVDDIAELFGNRTQSGFAELAGYDLSGSGGNGDGLISASDTVWATLQVWQGVRVRASGGWPHGVANGDRVTILRTAVASNDNDAWREAAFHFVQREAA